MLESHSIRRFLCLLNFLNLLKFLCIHLTPPRRSL